MPDVTGLVSSLVAGPGRLVRSILFDKTPGANWKVAWHQDVTIAVEARRDVEGFGPWSIKQGVPCVQPPVAILDGMVTIRLHLDACGADNGPVRVIAGSHRYGRLSTERIDELVASQEPVICAANPGDALIMRPLLLHASSPAVSPAHRRVVHLDFAGCRLPGGLEWSRLA